MATVFKRKVYSYRDGKPRQTGTSWTAKYQDRNNEWKMKAVPAPHDASRGAAQRWADDYEDEQRKAPVAPADAPEVCGTLMDKWIESLKNRSEDDDRSRYRLHVRPVFANVEISKVSVATIMRWIDAQRAGKTAAANAPPTEKKRGRKPKAGRLSDGTIRHNLNLLSRFFSWAVMRGHVAANPVRSIPTNARPQQAPKKDVPYLKDNALVRKLLGALPSPINLMFYIGHTSGLRLGEICGLRLSDMAKINAADDSSIRARYSYDGPLKEDKKKAGLSKLAPVGDEAEQLLRPWINGRLAKGAQPEDYLFVNGDGAPYDAQAVERAWNEATGRAERADRPKKRTKAEEKRSPLCTLSFYEATRHSFTSRLLEAGNSFDEVSAALNHSSPVVTARYYAHFKREKFSPTMRVKLGVGAPKKGAPKKGKLLPFQSA